MNVEERIKRCILIQKINKNEEKAKKVGLINVSKFNKEKETREIK